MSNSDKDSCGSKQSMDQLINDVKFGSFILDMLNEVGFESLCVCSDILTNCEADTAKLSKLQSEQKECINELVGEIDTMEHGVNSLSSKVMANSFDKDHHESFMATYKSYIEDIEREIQSDENHYFEIQEEIASIEQMLVVKTALLAEKEAELAELMQREEELEAARKRDEELAIRQEEEERAKRLAEEKIAKRKKEEELAKRRAEKDLSKRREEEERVNRRSMMRQKEVLAAQTNRQNKEPPAVNTPMKKLLHSGKRVSETTPPQMDTWKKFKNDTKASGVNKSRGKAAEREELQLRTPLMAPKKPEKDKNGKMTTGQVALESQLKPPNAVTVPTKNTPHLFAAPHKPKEQKKTADATKKPTETYDNYYIPGTMDKTMDTDYEHGDSFWNDT